MKLELEQDLIAPDEKTFDYLKNKSMSPKGENWLKAVKFWKTLYSDKECKFDKEINIDAKDIEPLVTWGTSPQDVASSNKALYQILKKKKMKIEKWL